MFGRFYLVALLLKLNHKFISNANKKYVLFFPNNLNDSISLTTLNDAIR